MAASENDVILVTPDYIKHHQQNPNFIVLDATIPVPGASPLELSSKQVIPGAIRFDVDKEFSDNTTFPHTLLAPNIFAEKVQALGINQDSHLVVYDDIGIFSSPRAWWIFKAMGHEKIYILNGGLNSWTSNGNPVEEAHQQLPSTGDFKSVEHKEYFCNIDEIKTAIENKILIIDARNADRFNSKVDEPRPNLRRGHIPTAKNLPFQRLLSENAYLEKTDLKKIMAEFTSDLSQPIIFYCGSGVTACINAVAAKICGYKDVKVYDGSWTEWGTLIPE